MLKKKFSDIDTAETIKNSIKEYPLFDGLTDDEKNIFLGRARIKRYRRGQYLFTQGDSVKDFYIVQNGVVRLFRTTPNGEEITSDILVEGDTICERKVFQFNAAHPDYALAVEDSTVLEFPSLWLRESVRKNATLSLNMLSLLSRRSLLKDIESEHQITMSTAQIVACFLQWLCSTHGFDPNNFELPYSKTLIASRLGMKQETFSRTLPKLKENGIHLQGARVIFHNFNDVDQYTCAQCSFIDDCPARKAIGENIVALPVRKAQSA
jgi:CRP-like cAMP-binding protein